MIAPFPPVTLQRIDWHERSRPVPIVSARRITFSIPQGRPLRASDGKNQGISFHLLGSRRHSRGHSALRVRPDLLIENWPSTSGSTMQLSSALGEYETFKFLNELTAIIGPQPVQHVQSNVLLCTAKLWLCIRIRLTAGGITNKTAGNMIQPEEL